ncbi:hypothetical protein BH11MYX1_BH11MYX1_51990 [soil metagenome]
MRSTLVVGIMVVAGVAAADPFASPALHAPNEDAYVTHRSPPMSDSGMWIDLGVNATRLDGGNGLLYRGDFGRFAPMVQVDRTFYIGGELDIGSMTAVIGPTNNAARTTTNQPMELDTSGTLAVGKLVGGARVTAGPFSGAVELAPGIRYIELPSTYGSSINIKTEGVLEARGRVDLWANPVLTIGGIVGADLAHHSDVMVGLQLGLHFERSERQPRY